MGIFPSQTIAFFKKGCYTILERTVETMDVGPHPCNMTSEQDVHCMIP